MVGGKGEWGCRESAWELDGWSITETGWSDGPGSCVFIFMGTRTQRRLDRMGGMYKIKE